MTHQSPLIVVLVVGLGLAFVFGTIANRLKLSPLVGYLLAGVAIGPFTPGYVADPGLTLQLAELGVILLMFGVGLHFAPRDLLAVRAIAIPGAVLQVLIASSLGAAVAWMLGWSVGTGIVFGLALSVASTVVMMRALQERRLMDSERGRIAVGWLVVQDLLTVIALVLLPPLAGLLKGGAALDSGALALSLGFTFGKLIAFVALMLIVGRRVVPMILHYIAHTGSRELFRLAVLVVALGVAFAAATLFGVSIALGAFFAGMILSESPLSQRAAEETLPLRDAFAVLFFVSVGMLFDPLTLLHEPLALCMTVAVVVIGGAGSALLITRLFGNNWATALLIAAGLAQIGEFSFILADLGIGLHLMPERARELILGTSIITIFINPFLFTLAGAVHRRFAAKSEPKAELVVPVTTDLSGHVILVGYGRVGRLIAEGVRKDGLPLLVIENGRDSLALLSAAGIPWLEGNAAEDPVLAAANLKQARLLFVAIPEAFEAGQIVQQARRARADLPIIARAHFDAEVEHLTQRGANVVVMGEREIALSMLEQAHIAH